MKILKYILLFCIPFMAACSGSNTYTGEDGESDFGIENNESSSEVPIHVYVSPQDFFALSSRAISRGVGELNNADLELFEAKLNSINFHLFAFRDKDSHVSSLTADPDLTKSSCPTSSSYDREKSDCILDGDDYYLGAPATLSIGSQGTMAIHTAEKRYFSTAYQDAGFNFFANFLDDAAYDVQRTKDRIVYNVEFDGTQDLMFGYAPRLESDMFSKDGLYPNVKISQSELNRVLQIGSYSTFASHRGIYPVVNLKHLLTQLNFIAVPAAATAKDIKIKGIQLEAPCKGTLVAAAASLDNVGFTLSSERKMLTLQEKPSLVDGQIVKSTGGLNKDYPLVYDPESDITSQKLLKLGDGMMVGADTSYKLYITFEMPSSHGNTPKEATAVYTIDAEKLGISTKNASGKSAFLSGHSYSIKLYVYGEDEIKVFASLDSWITVGDDIIVTPDE